MRLRWTVAKYEEYCVMSLPVVPAVPILITDKANAVSNVCVIRLQLKRCDANVCTNIVLHSISTLRKRITCIFRNYKTNASVFTIALMRLP